MKYLRNLNHTPIFLLTLFFLILNLIVAKDILIEGRFWAEEGTLYWANSYYRHQNGPIFAHLVYQAPLSGYLNLIANTLTFLSVQTNSLYWQPFITTWTSFFLMLLPSFVVYFYLLNQAKLVRYFLFTLLLFSPPAFSGEIFANSINLQVFLSLSCVIFLFTKYIPKKLRIPYYLILIISGLSTLYVLLLIPFYLIHFILQKKHVPYLNGSIILIMCGLIQFLYNFMYPYKYLFYERAEINNFSKLFETISLSFLNFFGGNILVLTSVNLINSSIIFVFFSILIFLFFLVFNQYIKTPYFYWLAVILFFLYCLFISFGAANQVGYGRYGYVPGLLVGFILFFKFQNFITIHPIFAFGGLFLFFVVIYMYNYSHYVEFIKKPEYCPTWSNQVSQIKTNLKSELLFWPCYKEPIWKLPSNNIKPSIMEFQNKILSNQSS